MLCSWKSVLQENFGEVVQMSIRKSRVHGLPVTCNKFAEMECPHLRVDAFVLQDSLSSGGSKWAPRRSPPTEQNFLNFMQFFGKSGKFVCWRPSPGGLRLLLREILDPPLLSVIYKNFILLFYF